MTVAAIVLLSLLHAGSAVLMAFSGPAYEHLCSFLGAYALCFATMLGLWRLLPAKRRSVVLICALGLTARAVMLPCAPSDDLSRYRWEGLIQKHGFNPYDTPPDAPELADLRTEYWSEINHKEIPTIYGPSAQLLFRGLSAIADSAFTFKIAFVLFDLATAVVLILIAAHFSLAAHHLALYLLNPLVVVFIAGEGHMESMYVFFVVAAVWGAARGRERLLFSALGTAVTAKITPLVFLPFVVHRGALRAALAFFTPMILWLLFWSAEVLPWSVPFRFATEFHYNGPVFSLFALIFDPANATLLSFLTAAAALTGVFFLTPDRIRAMFLASCVFLLCTPTLHPWYLLLITPFLAVYRPPAWIVLHLSIAATFVVTARYAETHIWRESGMVLAIEFVPFVAAALWSICREGRSDPGSYAQPRDVSVVVPTFNERLAIESCLESVARQSRTPREVVVADGGSDDGTVEYVKSQPTVKLVRCGAGRGVQIRAAMEHVQSDVVLVVHADAQLERDALARVRDSLIRHPDAAGGALGAAFHDRRITYRFIELLNNLRARLAGISFGDQGQFFRTEALPEGFPDYVLMEDVELAFRMKQAGTTLFLGGGVRSSVRRWERKVFAKNFVRVVHLTALFVVMRRVGLVRDQCRSFYRRYYGREAPLAGRHERNA